MAMKKNILYIVLFSLLGFSCEDNFKEYNTNTDRVQVGSNPEVRFSLGPITETLRMNGGIKTKISPEYAEHVSHSATSSSIQRLESGNEEGDWAKIYKVFPTIRDVISRTEDSEDNQEKFANAIAKISQAYLFTTLSDMFGDIPYSEAGLMAVSTPTYDTQESIYKDAFSLIDNALTKLSTTKTVPLKNDDRVYGGDVDKWKKFANSLKLRLAIRMRYVAPTEASTYVTQAMEHADGLISNEDESGTYEYNDVNNERNPYYNDKDWQLRISKLFVDFMQSTNDPRLSYFADTVEQGVLAGQYYGLDNNLDTNNLMKYHFSGLSQEHVFRQDLPDMILMHSEVEFLKAEAYLFGFGVSKDEVKANQAYRAGIEANMTHWGVSQTDIDAFLAQTLATLSGTDEEKFKQIAEQKWVSLFLTPETWTEARRTKYPVLPETAGNSSYYEGVTKGKMPSRLAYPENEEERNETNYNVAGKKYANNSITSKLWWDKK
jgi:hypothetical protein